MQHIGKGSEHGTRYCFYRFVSLARSIALQQGLGLSSPDCPLSLFSALPPTSSPSSSRRTKGKNLEKLVICLFNQDYFIVEPRCITQILVKVDNNLNYSEKYYTLFGFWSFCAGLETPGRWCSGLPLGSALKDLGHHMGCHGSNLCVREAPYL